MVGDHGLRESILQQMCHLAHAPAEDCGGGERVFLLPLTVTIDLAAKAQVCKSLHSWDIANAEAICPDRSWTPERNGKERKRRERKGKGKERKGKERKGKRREGKGREGKGREGKGREGKEKKRKGCIAVPASQSSLAVARKPSVPGFNSSSGARRHCSGLAGERGNREH
eukprot:1139767-Pelagomonas_calceolata.AAC.7